MVASPAMLNPKQKLLTHWRDLFVGEPSVIASAPGRVNLIGEHTDYNEGFVFPAAIDRRTWCLTRATDGPARLVSIHGDKSVEFVEGDGAPRGWGRYAAACLRAMQDEVGAAPRIEGVIWSNVPSGSGLSSSAALEVCILSAMNFACKLGLTNLGLARIAWRAEREYVGVDCGIMDQMASALGEHGKALFIDTRSQHVQAVPIPRDLLIAVLDTRVPRSLAASAYNERVAECARAVAGLESLNPAVRSLRDADRELLERSRSAMDEVAFRRARHVVTENARALSFKRALETGDRRELSRLCRESHESLRDDYDVSSEELNAMARAAWNAPGCVAARLTGAGFGGCCVALVERAAYAEFEKTVEASYGMYGFREPVVFSTEAAEGTKAGPTEPVG